MFAHYVQDNSIEQDFCKIIYAQISMSYTFTGYIIFNQYNILFIFRLVAMDL